MAPSLPAFSPHRKSASTMPSRPIPQNSGVSSLASFFSASARAGRRELDDAVLVLEERGAPSITSGPGRSSAAVGAGVSSGSGGPAADMYERLVRAVLGRDKEASARPEAQETAERLLRVLQSQARNLKVKLVRLAVRVGLRRKINVLADWRVSHCSFPLASDRPGGRVPEWASTRDKRE